MGRYRSSIALAGAGLLISIFLIAKGPRLGEKGAAPLRAAAADLDMRQRELAAAVEARATTLAQLPRLSWAVATDEETVRDLTTDEHGFRVQPGELIEVAQIDKATSRATSLLHAPATASLHAPMADLGPRLLVSGDQMLVASIVGIEPRERTDVIRGALVVARQLDVEGTANQLIRAGIAARLVAPAGSVTLTEVPALARQPEVSVPVGTSPLRLVGRLPAPRTAMWVLIGILVFLIWGGAAAVAAQRARVAPAGAAGGDIAPPRSTSSASFGALPDTTPVLDLVVAERNITASSSNGVHGTNGVAAPIVEIVSGPVAAGVPHTDAIPASTGDFKALFREFLDLRKRCGDRSKAPAYDEFVKLLDQRRTEMLKAHAATEVFFQIVFIDGRAVVRAKGVS